MADISQINVNNTTYDLKDSKAQPIFIRLFTNKKLAEAIVTSDWTIFQFEDIHGISITHSNAYACLLRGSPLQMRLYFLASDSSGTYDSDTCYLLNWYYDSAHSRYTITNNYQEPLMDDNGCSAGYWSLSLYFNIQKTCILEAMIQADTKYPNSDLIDLSKIEYDNTSSGLTATDAQTAIDEVKTSIPTVINDLSDVEAYSPSKGEVLVYDGASMIGKHGWVSTDATQIGYDNSSSGLSADYVGDAIDELDARKSIISTTWNDITNSTSPLPNATRYTGKEIHSIANDIDASLSDNGISSTQYAGMYVQDSEKNNIGKCALNVSTGNIGFQLYANDPYSSTTNSLTLNVAKNGTRSVTVSDAVVWRKAIGPELLTSSPSSFSNKTISTGGSWTNLGSQAFPKGGLYLVLYTVRWDEVTSGSSITAGKGYRKTCIASTPTGGPTSNQHLCLGPSTPTDDTVQEMTCVIDTLSAANNQTQYFQCAQTSGYSMTAMGRYTIIRLI